MVSKKKATKWENAGVVCTANSPYALLKSVPIRAVTLREGFWKPRLEANRDNGIPAFLAWLDRDDQTAPFRAYAIYDNGHPELKLNLSKLKRNWVGDNATRWPHRWRSNVHAWLEATAFSIQSGDPYSATRSILDMFAQGIARAHRDKAFWDAYYGPDFTTRDDNVVSEGLTYGLATPGHMIQAAIAHYRATGSTEFLDCAEQVAEKICCNFEGENFAGHSCIEMALVELYRTTAKDKYLAGARHFLTPLLRQPPVIGPPGGSYELRHVVRVTYLLSAGADYYAETGDREFLDKLTAIWDDMVTGKLHITGQLSADLENWETICKEPFNLSTGVFDGLGKAGLELCEAVGNIFWNWRMLSITGEAKHADLLERTLFNGFLAHASLDHNGFQYITSLSSNGDQPYQRVIWGEGQTSCCPPNALRLFASLPGYFFGTSADGVWIHLYDNCQMDWRLADGTRLVIEQKTKYPWEGHVSIDVRPDKATVFDLYLRIPEWCRMPQVLLNTKPVGTEVRPGSYCRLRREWRKGDTVTLDLTMPVVATTADPRAVRFHGKTALCRGPLIYCLEDTDNPGLSIQDTRVAVGSRDILQDAKEIAACFKLSKALDGFEAVWEPTLLRGVVTIKGSADPIKVPTRELKFIPYYAWGNRNIKALMRVWIDRMK